MFLKTLYSNFELTQINAFLFDQIYSQYHTFIFTILHVYYTVSVSYIACHIVGTIM